MKGSFRTLIIDDDPLVAEAVSAALSESKRAHFSVESASRMAAARGILDSNGIDLVVLDLGLPDSSGFEGLHVLLSNYPSVAVVVLTGNYDFANALRAISLGAQEFMPKPIMNIEDFAADLCFAVARHRFTRKAVGDARNEVRRIEAKMLARSKKNSRAAWIGIATGALGLLTALATLLRELV